MKNDFRSSLIWHMTRHETKIVDLVRGTGISRDVINKLVSRENSSTSAENALLIASFYGKPLEQFINCDDGAAVSELKHLIELLQPSEARLLEAQVRGILRHRSVLSDS